MIGVYNTSSLFLKEEEMLYLMKTTEAFNYRNMGWKF